MTEKEMEIIREAVAAVKEQQAQIDMSAPVSKNEVIRSLVIPLTPVLVTGVFTLIDSFCSLKSGAMSLRASENNLKAASMRRCCCND